jgi:hypothetical protein
MSKKPAKRKDGKPTRATKRRVNQASFAAGKKKLKDYMPPVARARYQAIVDELNKGGELATEQAKQQAILSLIVGGLSLRWAREIVGVTHWAWHQWLHADEDLKKEYAQAKEERTEAWADDIMDDAESANAFNVQAVRLRIETKKWLMGKHSGRYADKMVVAGDPENPLHQITTNMPIEEAQALYAAGKNFKPKA